MDLTKASYQELLKHVQLQRKILPKDRPISGTHDAPLPFCMLQHCSQKTQQFKTVPLSDLQPSSSRSGENIIQKYSKWQPLLWRPDFLLSFFALPRVIQEVNLEHYNVTLTSEARLLFITAHTKQTTTVHMEKITHQRPSSFWRASALNQHAC